MSRVTEVVYRVRWDRPEQQRKKWQRLPNIRQFTAENPHQKIHNKLFYIGNINGLKFAY
jgi:hypothetical protein